MLLYVVVDTTAVNYCYSFVENTTNDFQTVNDVLYKILLCLLPPHLIDFPLELQGQSEITWLLSITIFMAIVAHNIYAVSTIIFHYASSRHPVTNHWWWLTSIIYIDVISSLNLIREGSDFRIVHRIFVVSNELF